MATMDVFSSDAFSLNTLTAAINEQPYVPGRVGEIGLFEEEGITTTTAIVESQSGALALVDAKTRGAPGQVVVGDPRKARSFIVPHLPETSSILADSIQNIRAFGSENQLQAIEQVRDARLAKMRRNLDATMEHHRIGAIKGQILDADGSTTIFNLFTEFGVAQQTHAMALTTTTTKVRQKVLQAKKKGEDELGNAPILRWHAFCGDTFFEELIDHDNVRSSYERWMEGEALRNDPRAGFMFGDVTWERYRGSVGGVSFVGTDDAYLFPVGVPGMFIGRFAPANYMETVNTVGLPYYAKADPMDFDKGVNLEAQSNPLYLCTRPRAVIKLTKV